MEAYPWVSRWAGLPKRPTAGRRLPTQLNAGQRERRPKGPPSPWLAPSTASAPAASPWAAPAPVCASGVCAPNIYPQKQTWPVSIQALSLLLSEPVRGQHTHLHCINSERRLRARRGSRAAEGPAWIPPNFLESLSSEKLLEPAPEAPLLSCSMETPCQSMDDWRINGLIFCQQHTHCCQISPPLCSKISSPVCPCSGTGGTRGRCPGPHAGPKIRNSGGQEGPWPGFHPPRDPHGHRMDRWMWGVSSENRVTPNSSPAATRPAALPAPPPPS